MPVGDGRIGKQFWLVAEHGMKSGYIRNIEPDSRVRLKLRLAWRYVIGLQSCFLGCVAAVVSVGAALAAHV
jgi:hypothetical protein